MAGFAEVVDTAFVAEASDVLNYRVLAGVEMVAHGIFDGLYGEADVVDASDLCFKRICHKN